MRIVLAAMSGGLLSTALVAWRTWPFAISPPRGHFDWLYAAWALAWRLQGGGADANIYAPTPDALYYGPPCLGLLPFMALTSWWTPDTLHALQLAYFVALAATGASVACVVTAWTGSLVASAIAVLALFGSTALVVLPYGAPQWAALSWFAPLVWAMGRPPAWGTLLLVAVLMAAQALAEPVYMAPVVFAVVVVAGLVRCLRGERRHGLVLLGGTVLSALLLAPFLAGYARVRAANPHLAEQTLWVVRPFGTPAEQAWLEMRSMLSEIGGVPLLVLVPMLLLAWRSRARWLDAVTLVVVPMGLMLAVPLLRMVPGLEGLPLRAPGRLILGSCVGAALLAGLAWHAVPPPRRLVGLGLLAGWYALLPPIVMTEHTPVTPNPSLVTSLVRIGRGAVLELPADATRAPSNAIAMYRSIPHGRPLVNGYASYWPQGWPQRMDDVALLPDREALARLVASTGLTTIVVHLDEMNAATRRRWTQPFQLPGLVPLLPTGQVLVFNVRP